MGHMLGFVTHWLDCDHVCCVDVCTFSWRVFFKPHAPLKVVKRLIFVMVPLSSWWWCYCCCHHRQKAMYLHTGTTQQPLAKNGKKRYLTVSSKPRLSFFFLCKLLCSVYFKPKFVFFFPFCFIFRPNTAVSLEGFMESCMCHCCHFHHEDPLPRTPSPWP